MWQSHSDLQFPMFTLVTRGQALFERDVGEI